MMKHYTKLNTFFVYIVDEIMIHFPPFFCQTVEKNLFKSAGTLILSLQAVLCVWLQVSGSTFNALFSL